MQVEKSVAFPEKITKKQIKKTTAIKVKHLLQLAAETILFGMSSSLEDNLDINKVLLKVKHWGVISLDAVVFSYFGATL